jgi:hypothetical protein
MRIVIDVDETLTVGICIEGVEGISQKQARALRYIAVAAGEVRDELLSTPEVVSRDLLAHPGWDALSEDVGG